MKIEELRQRKRSMGMPEIIERVFNDFDKELNGSTHPCKLRVGAFDDSDYGNKLVQQNYLLHYMIAYAFEYKELYRCVLEDSRIRKKSTLRIDSLGCGSTIDYWSLVEVVKELGYDYLNIRYYGVDSVEWQYSFGKESNLMKKTMLIEDVAKYFGNCESLEADVYVFPRSICDFSDESFNAIRRAFRYSTIRNDHVYLAFSGIEFSDPKKQSFCQERIRDLKKSMENNRNLFTIEYENSYHCSSPEKGITALDRSLRYPSGVLDSDNRLKVECAKWIDKGFCEKCGIFRKPMLTCGHINFLILKYKRRGM